MKTQILHQKLERYMNGQSLPAETRQIQNWLSCTTTEDVRLTDEQKLALENDILKEIQAYTAYPLFFPKREKPWWQKMVASFL
jgi:hypothetical protein